MSSPSKSVEEEASEQKRQQQQRLYHVEADIAAKQRAQHGSNNGKNTVLGAKIETRNGLDQLESDLLAKQRASNVVGSGAQVGFGANPSSTTNPSSLSQLEADLLSKQRSSSSSSGVVVGATTTNSLQHLEADIQAKQRASGGSSGAFPATVGAYYAQSATTTTATGLNQLEADVLSKQRTSSSTTTSTSLNQLEADVRAKQQVVSGPNSATAGATSNLNRLESDLLAKQSALGVNNNSYNNTSNSSRLMLTQLETDMLAKQQGSSSDRKGPPTEQALLEDTNKMHTIDLVDNNNTGGHYYGQRQPPVSLSSDMNNQQQYIATEGAKGLDGKYNTNDDGDNTEHYRESYLNAIQNKEEDGLDAVGLAVAIPVDPNDDELDNDIFRPAAVEYDVDAKEAKDRERKNRTITIFFAIFVPLIIVIGVVVGVLVSKQESPATEPEPIPLDPRETLGIREYILSHIDPNDIDQNTGVKNPYTKAMDWIVLTDPMKLTVESPYLLQRYALSYLYFALSEQYDWTYCGPKNVITDNTSSTTTDDDDGPCFDKNVIVPTKYDRDHEYKLTNERWLSEYEECKWVGVTCSDESNSFGEVNQHVKFIDLRYFNITGQFPYGAKHLPFIEEFSIMKNQLSGSIQGIEIVKNWKYLRLLDLQDNQLSGTFPNEILDARNLYNIRFYSNTLQGTISQDINKMKDLRQLIIFNNQLNGPFPRSINEIGNLFNLAVGDNELTGPIPNSVGKWTYMRELNLTNNELTGTIPDDIGNLTELKVLNFDNNNMNGTIPESFYTMASLETVNFNRNKFTGTISSNIGNLEALGWFYLNSNLMNGTIPIQFGNLSFIYELALDDNDFTGTIPSALCQLNSIMRIDADCLANNNDDTNGVAPEITCPTEQVGCCTKCCNRDGTVCEAQ